MTPEPPFRVAGHIFLLSSKLNIYCGSLHQSSSSGLVSRNYNKLAGQTVLSFQKILVFDIVLRFHVYFIVKSLDGQLNELEFHNIFFFSSIIRLINRHRREMARTRAACEVRWFIIMIQKWRKSYLKKNFTMAFCQYLASELLICRQFVKFIL